MMRERIPHFAAESNAQIVLGGKEEDDVVVADIICDAAHGYSVDPLGKDDSTEGIRAALRDCFALGGGTVHLPVGSYRITHRIEVPSFVCLHGDYADPDRTTEYGTVLLCDMESTYRLVGNRVNVFRMAGCSALIGLTFCYPHQSFENVLPYGYAIEIPGKIDNRHYYMFTLKNLTFLNVYRGICCSIPVSGVSHSHEQLFLENIKGTFLRNAMRLTNSSEVGAFHTIEISPRYWLHAVGCEVPQDGETLQKYCERNLHALIFGDLEWQQIENVAIEHCRTGIEFRKGDRIADPPLAFIGEFFNLRIEHCFDGLVVRALYIRLGIEFARCRIAAQRYAVINHSPPEEGQLLFCGCNLSGKIKGANLYFSARGCCGERLVPRPIARYRLPRRVLYHALANGICNDGSADCTAPLQRLLDEAEAAGGGIVYCPAGRYLLAGEIRIGAHTQLRGAGMHITKDLARGDCLGTTFLCFSAPAVTLCGDGSSFCSAKLLYPEQNAFRPERFRDMRETVAVQGNNIAMLNLYFVNANRGIRIENSADFLCKRVMGGFFRNMFFLKDSKGTIDTCLANAIAVHFVSRNVHVRMADWESDLKAVVERVYPFSRANNVLVEADSSRVEIRGLFTYASHTFLRAAKSEISAVNVGFDSQPPGEGCCFELTESGAEVCNLLRDACGTRGELYRNNRSVLTLCNCITLLLNNSTNPDGDIVENNPIKKQ